MRKTLFVMAVLGFVLAAPPVATRVGAQQVQVRFDLPLGIGRLSGILETRHHYGVSRDTYCEADGRFLYCWEPAYRRSRRVEIHIYERPAIRRDHPGRGLARGHLRQLERDRARAYERAAHFYRAWFDAQGYRYRDDVDIRIVWRR